MGSSDRRSTGRVGWALGCLLGLLWLAGSTGCTPLGNYYQRVTQIPPGAALVYVYRPSGFVGAALELEVSANGRPVGVLPNGGYFHFVAPPGPTQLVATPSESQAAVVLDLVPGRVHFVRGGVGIGLVVGRGHLEVIPNQIAEPEIASCRLALPGR